jgi:hypothetical protein
MHSGSSAARHLADRLSRQIVNSFWIVYRIFAVPVLAVRARFFCQLDLARHKGGAIDFWNYAAD